MGADGYGVRGRSHRFGARGAGGERRTRCSKAKLNAYRNGPSKHSQDSGKHANYTRMMRLHRSAAARRKGIERLPLW
jgi:hypothetical protein